MQRRDEEHDTWVERDGEPVVWEACVPAEILNRYPRCIVVYDDDTDQWRELSG